MTETDFLLWLQDLRNPLLTAFFAAVTFLGSQEFAMVLIPLIYWCFNRTLGLRIAWVLLASSYANEVLKNLAMTSRPGPPLIPLHPETASGGAWPSGHAMNAAAVWGTLAGLVRGRQYLLAALAVIFLIGFSRLYLALHWPADVIAGWAIGAVMALAALWLYRTFPRVQAETLPPALLLGAGLLPIALVLLSPTETGAVAMGTALGALLGWWLERRYVGFEAPAPLAQQVAKLLIGVAGVLLLRYGLKPVLEIIPNIIIADFLRYCVIGLWVTYLAPAVFVRLFGRRTAEMAQARA